MTRHARRSLAGFMLLAVFLLAPVTSVYSEARVGQWNWCHMEKIADDAHPLSWRNLRDRIESLDTPEDYASAYVGIVRAFEEVYGENDPNSVLLREALDEYFQIREEEGERPNFWRSVSQREPWLERLQLGTLGRIDVPCEMELDGEWDDFSSSRIGLLYAAAAIHALASEDLGVIWEIAAKRVEETYESHRNWLFDGLAMWPWEMKLNEWRIDERFESKAPDWQWVFLRPGLAAAIHFDGIDGTSLDSAFILEPLGFVRYVKDSHHARWWGLSAMVSVTDDSGAGYGILARYNEFVAGVGYHERHNDVMVYLSIDLARIVQGKNRWAHEENRLQEGRRARLDEMKRAAPAR